MSKFTKTLGLEQTLRFDSASAPILYIGLAAPGVVESALLWQITQIDTASGVKMLFPSGDSSFLYSWTDRATYTYS